jgi:predicted NAD/FAD-dependent oxidoreductase
MDPCLVSMLHFDVALPVDREAVFFEASDLAWAARDSSKPGRSTEECWILHAASGFSRDHLEEPPEVFVPRMITALAEGLGIELPPRRTEIGHAWRYAFVREPLAHTDLLVAAHRLGACGDWRGTSRIETAYESGQELARAVLRAS